MSKEALKLALETLEVWKGYMPAVWDKTDEQAITALREALAEQPAQDVPETNFWDKALNKMAENARELGLDYEPAQDSGIVTAGGFDPRTQRTWVGLSDEEISARAANFYNPEMYKRAALWAQEKLKERNQ